MPYKIATASVEVVPDDSRFEDDLRAAIEAATEGVKAEIPLQLNEDADIVLSEDVHAAIDFATAGVAADIGLRLKDDAIEALDADVKAAADVAGQDAKVRVSVDPKSAGDMQQGMSSLIVAGVTAAAAVGAPLLLAGLGAAFVGVTAIALDQNKVIAADYKSLGAEAEKSLQQAVAPLAPTMHAAVTSLEADVKTLQPTLDGLFANANPDITSFATGVENLAGGALPGLSKALGNSQGIAQDVAASMGTLGAGVGTFFTGLTRDSTTTGQGLSDVVSIASSALGTLGNIAGSASSALSADLMAVTPAIDGVLAGLNKLSNPATVGAAVGAFAGFKLGGPIESGLNSASNGLLNIAAKADGAGGFLGKLSGAAEGSSLGLSKMTGVMGGPWGIAIGAGVGLVSGLVGQLISADSATKAVTVSQLSLQQAVSQDGDAAGQATAAYITAADAANGINNAAASAGVTMGMWTQAVLGNKQAQEGVTAAVEKTNQAQVNQTAAATNAAGATNRAAVELHGGEVAATSYAAKTNQLTDANQKLLNTMNAQTQQVANAISAETKYQQALGIVDNSQQLFNASLAAAHNSLVANAQSSALTTVGSLNLGNANYALTSSLNTVVTSYNEASAQGSAYGQVLTALSGNTNNLLSSEAAFTTSLAGVTAAVKANGTSLDVNTAKGAANITVLTGMATAADKAAVSVYQNEVNTKGATQAYDDANAKLLAEKDAFEQAAEKAGFNKTQVQALANELFKLPANIPVSVNVNTASIKTALSEMSQLESEGANVSQQEVSVIKQTTRHAQGGPSVAGQAEIVGDGGRAEYFVPRTDGYVYPSVAEGQQAIASHNARVAANSPVGGGAQVNVSQHFYGPQYPDTTLAATMRFELATALGGV